MLRTDSKLALHALDSPAPSMEELSDDLLLVILAEVDWKALASACCTSQRLRSLASEPDLWRSVLCEVMRSKSWQVEPHQLCDHQALRRPRSPTPQPLMRAASQ